MTRYDIVADSAYEQMEELERQGKTAMLFAIDRQYAVLIAVADTIKDTSEAR